MTTTTTTTTQIQTQNKTEESPDNIRTAFHFLKWQDLYNIERPFQIYIEIPPDAPDQRRHNLVFEEGEETIVHNVRDRLDEFSLDRNDFVYLKHATQATKERFADREFLRTVYLPECEQLIRERVDGVDQVFIFDWRVRLHLFPSFCLFYFKDDIHGADMLLAMDHAV